MTIHRIASPWESVRASKPVFRRYDAYNGPVAVVTTSKVLNGSSWRWSAGEGPTFRYGEVRSKEDAFAAADEALRADGWVLG